MGEMNLTVEQLAEYLRISTWTAYELVHKKGFPSFRVGKRILVGIEDLKKWTDEQKSKGV
ncbi:MAG: helix-turn-helix domain-containing protein [Clostridia bacterium]|nr:helix-turn-helix domain-containing protein [Clostridia bacterium]